MNLDSISFQRKLHKNFNYKINFRYTLQLSEIIQTSTFIIKKLKTSIQTSNPSVSWKTQKLRLVSNNYLKNSIYVGNYHHLPMRMLKVFPAIVDDFN